MSKEKLRSLLQQLHEELTTTEVDAETLALIKTLDADIQALVEADPAQGDSASVVERAKSLEAGFASKHPTAERFMREVIDALGKMGI